MVRLSLTQLESRDVPAGGVVAEMVGSTLVVTGDELDNLFWIDAVGGEVTVSAYQTTVNGLTEPATFRGVTRVEMIGGDGDDNVQAFTERLLGSSDAVGELRIDTGSGRDFAHVNWHSECDVWIDTGDGADVAGVFSAFGDHGDGEVRIATGDGADRVVLDLRGHTDGAIYVDTGNGNDVVEVMLEGGHTGGRLSILTGNGNDEVTLHTTFGGVGTDVTIDGGNGIDSLLYNPDRFVGVLDIRDFEN